MAKSVGARINEDLYEWLDEKADREKTTKARIVENLILKEYRQDVESTSKIALSEVPQLKNIDEEPIVEAENHEMAEEIRDMLGEWLAEDDDARLNDVRFASDVPDDILRDAREIIVGHMRENAPESA